MALKTKIIKGVLFLICKYKNIKQILLANIYLFSTMYCVICCFYMNFIYSPPKTMR